jgi:NAD(P)-dependent dehydrogenase (short-subunit alcohol dehydrogenase family)
MTRFAGRVTVVTGAGSGLGRATAGRLADEGAPTACLDVDPAAAERTAAEIAPRRTARPYRVDVSDPRSVREAVDGRCGISAVPPCWSTVRASACS